jgi:hypothetical protein
MANKKANEPRVLMKVPVSFRDAVYAEAKKMNINATVYLEGKKVIPA